jgi:hypothetical protein
MRPKYVHDLLWGNIADDISPTVRYSLSAEQLPCPPQSELQNLTANETISGHPKLCKIVCKINTRKFNDLLRDHPNQLFVQSMIVGLTEGFWPWAEPQDGDKCVPSLCPYSHYIFALPLHFYSIFSI